MYVFQHTLVSPLDGPGTFLEIANKIREVSIKTQRVAVRESLICTNWEGGLVLEIDN